MADFSELPKDMDNLGRYVYDKLTPTVLREAALMVLKNLVMNNPIDTGRSSGNWHASVGQPTWVVTEPPASDGSPHEARQAATSFRNANYAVQYSKIQSSDVNPSSTLYITNGVDYVEALNTYRPSKQQAPHWVERSIEATIENITLLYG